MTSPTMPHVSTPACPAVAPPASVSSQRSSVENPSSCAAKAPIRFVPNEPKSLEETGLAEHDVESLVLKQLMKRGTLTGRRIAENLHLPRPIAQESLERLRAELLIAIKGAASLDDYVYHLTEAGFERARRETALCSYAAAAPVRLEDYTDAVKQQSLQQNSLTVEQLQRTFHELRLSELLLSQLGQAISDGRGLFLYGSPGNGKTSLSELVVSVFGEFVWIPYTITIDGELVRLYDPRCHEAVDLPNSEDLQVDHRWVLIRRPTIVVGGELSMHQLDLQYNTSTGISEAPVQLRANGGALVVDDFGRQRMPTSELLNRLIVPMEKHHDYLSLSSGRQASVPFDMLLVFSTNLEPRDLVDEAFLRRIPYKIEVEDPTVDEFVSLFQELASKQGCRCDAEAIDHLLAKHYREAQRPLRFCHPRDLLRQIRNYCQFHHVPLEVTKQTIDVAVRNYFAGL